MRRTAVEDVFGLCAVVSPLQFFQQFSGEVTAALCSGMVLRRLSRGATVHPDLEEEERNALCVILEGTMVQQDEGWRLQPGDTFFGRGGTVVAETEEALVGIVDKAKVPETTAYCWTPVLARDLMRKPSETRTPADVGAIVDLLSISSEYGARPPDLRAAIARLLTFRILRAGDRVSGNENKTLYIVLSGEMVAAEQQQQRLSLRKGDSFPRHSLELAFEARSLASTTKNRRRRPRVIAAEFTVVTQRAEVMVLDVEEFVTTAFPSPEIPYSLEYCRSVLSAPPEARTESRIARLVADVLRYLPFFKQLPLFACRRLARHMHLKTLPHAAELGVEKCLVVVLSGDVVVVFEGRATRRRRRLKPCDVLLLLDDKEKAAALRSAPTNTFAPDLAVLSETAYRAVVPVRAEYPDVASAFAEDSPLAAVPACLRRRLARLAYLEHYEARQIVGSMRAARGLVLRGSVSLHFVEDNDDDEDLRLDLDSINGGDDFRARRAWAKARLGHCACALAAGDLIAPTFSSVSPPPKFGGGDATERCVAIARESTTLVKIDDSKNFSETPRTKLAARLAARMTKNEKYARPRVEDVLDLVGEELRGVPAPIKLRLAPKIEKVERGAAIPDGPALKFVLSGVANVDLPRRCPDLVDNNNTAFRRLWPTATRVGCLVPGDSLGGRGGVADVARAIAAAYETTRSLDAAAAAAAASTATHLAASSATTTTTTTTSITVTCQPATLLVIDVDDLCRAACAAAEAVFSTDRRLPSFSGPQKKSPDHLPRLTNLRLADPSDDVKEEESSDEDENPLLLLLRRRRRARERRSLLAVDDVLARPPASYCPRTSTARPAWVGSPRTSTRTSSPSSRRSKRRRSSRPPPPPLDEEPTIIMQSGLLLATDPDPPASARAYHHHHHHQRPRGSPSKTPRAVRKGTGSHR